MRKLMLVVAAAVVTLAPLASVMAAPAKVYQVTGPVLEVTDTMIVVQKGQDRWELMRDSSTKVAGDLKVGAKVTIEYRMTATSVQVKPSAGKTTTKTKGKTK